MFNLFKPKTGIDIAKTMVGLHEVKDQTKIMKFLDEMAIKKVIFIDPAVTAWCAAIMNAWERKIGKPGNGKLNARSFLTYGKKVDRKDAQHGDIVIFSRGGSNWQGHVAYLDKFVTGQNGEALVQTIGGNQSNAVSVGWYPESRLLGIRRS